MACTERGNAGRQQAPNSDRRVQFATLDGGIAARRAREPAGPRVVRRLWCPSSVGGVAVHRGWRAQIAAIAGGQRAPNSPRPAQCTSVDCGIAVRCARDPASRQAGGRHGEVWGPSLGAAWGAAPGALTGRGVARRFWAQLPGELGCRSGACSGSQGALHPAIAGYGAPSLAARRWFTGGGMHGSRQLPVAGGRQTVPDGRNAPASIAELPSGVRATPQAGGVGERRGEVWGALTGGGRRGRLTVGRRRAWRGAPDRGRGGAWRGSRAPGRRAIDRVWRWPPGRGRGRGGCGGGAMSGRGVVVLAGVACLAGWWLGLGCCGWAGWRLRGVSAGG